MDLKGKHFLKLLDWSSQEIEYLLKLSAQLKDQKKEGVEKQYLKGKNVALIFEKTSTRTRCAFEVAAADQGANTTYLSPDGSQIGHKESIADTAQVLGSMYDGIQYRGFGQKVVEELAQYAGVPVWNGLTDEFHPTQILADFLTIQECFDKPLSEVSFCYMGDARFNMANSYMVGCAKLGMDFRIAAPKAYQPDSELVKTCQAIAVKKGGKIMITENVQDAVLNADVICTDVWVSMGEPKDVWAERIQQLKPYQVNKAVMEAAQNEGAIFLHCLPAFHDLKTKVGQDVYDQFGIEGLEVTDEVFQSLQSKVFQEAGNRMHTIKAVMVATLSDIKI